ncbi:unnamed protein product [Dimorphilus gyrociliatus]|uniref:Uncharacterized protein n=1 Tax=Dimorphilus gyrociliatus TaxID=2664684 RepID=A0A7I8V4H9_9ANNE|nr:unnamed protein product [Dimorphilus gyrociliatus]
MFRVLTSKATWFQKSTYRFNAVVRTFSSSIARLQSDEDHKLTPYLLRATDLVGDLPLTLHKKLAKDFICLVEPKESIFNIIQDHLVKSDSDIRLLGTTVALISKIMEEFVTDDIQIVREKHLRLAEITEIIHSAIRLHNSVKNNSIFKDNKMSILIGDFLLASACLELAELCKPEVVDLIATALSHMSNYTFLKESTISDSSFSLAKWEEMVFMKTASLFANSCRATCAWNNVEGIVNRNLYEFGRNFGLAYELNRIRCKENSESDHLEYSLLSIVRDEKIHFEVQELSKRYCDLAEDNLGNVRDSEAKQILLDMINALRS